MAKPGPGSEIDVLNARALASQMDSEIPHVTSLNVTKSSRVHVGPKFISVNQTVQNEEMIKELPFKKFMNTVFKYMTMAERLILFIATGVLFAIIILAIHLTYFSKTEDIEFVDVAPHRWNITREMWLAEKYHHNVTTEKYNPLKLVIIQHTVSAECHVFKDCSAELRKMQQYFLTDKNLGYDIPYNFLIGNDGRIYEGRGWNVQGAHTYGYNSCSLGVGFIGDYRQTKVTRAQVVRFNLLLEDGVNMKLLDPKHYVIPAKDLRATESPGTNLYNAIKEWDTYDHQLQFRGRSCDEIYGKV